MMTQCANTDSCVEVNDLKMRFILKSGLFSKPKVLKAVDGVSSSIKKGRTVGLVRKSGCGKTTMGRTILEPYQATANRILYQGTDITGLSGSQVVPYRGKMQMIFQDSYASLDPRENIGDIIAEPIWATRLYTGEDKNGRVRELIEMVDLKSDHTSRYPHEFSGGQRQRTNTVKALATESEFIICDEPISALDVSIQAQVINILEELQDEFHLTYLFISHDLSMVCHTSSGVGVMYLGNLIEYTQADKLYGNMLHPYTQSLISTTSVADSKLVKENKRIILKGDVPLPTSPALGCPFRGRCRYTEDICSQAKPELKAVNDKHKVACHLFNQMNGARLT